MTATPPFPAPTQGIVLAHFIVSDDVERSRRFYTEVLGGQAVTTGEPSYVALANGWIIINRGGGPTDDKPTVTLEIPPDPNRTSSFLNIRVADIEAVYAEWSARGAEFLTTAEATRDRDPLLPPRSGWSPHRGRPDDGRPRRRAPGLTPLGTRCDLGSPTHERGDAPHELHRPRVRRRHDARDRRHPRLGRRPRQGVLRGSRVAARRRPRRRRLPDRPVQPAGLGVLDPVRRRPHVGRARVGAQPARRVRHRGRARRARRARRRRSEVFHDSSVGYNRFDRERPGERSRSRTDARTRRSRSSATRTATSGSCRRSRADCPAASTRRRRRSARSASSRERSKRAEAAHGEHEKRTGERDDELAGVVRRVHGGGADRRRAAE